LPSIQATQVTFPIISCPLDSVSYQAFMTPSGNATIATVGIERKFNKDVYTGIQRGRALRIAEKILDLEEDTVAVNGKNLDSLTKRLNDFGIKTHDNSKLVLTYNHKPLGEVRDCIQVWADPSLDASDLVTVFASEKNLNKTASTIQARSDQDLAIYAAKILSLRNPEMKEKITEMSKEKRKSYPERDLISELGK